MRNFCVSFGVCFITVAFLMLAALLINDLVGDAHAPLAIALKIALGLATVYPVAKTFDALEG